MIISLDFCFFLASLKNDIMWYAMFNALKVYSFYEMPKYIVHIFMLFLICFVQIWLGMKISGNSLL